MRLGLLAEHGREHVNYKRVERMYRLEGLAGCRRRQKQLAAP